MDEVSQQGYAIKRNVLCASEIGSLKEEIEKITDNDLVYGMRNVFSKSAIILDLIRSKEIKALISSLLGRGAVAVRSLYFDKNETANWHVAWHQDTTIAVRERRDVEGYRSWTIKDGAHHVRPPAIILENMLTLRIHLDRADRTNGALRVVPGSHALGHIPAAQISEVVKHYGETLCETNAGDILMMRPLILHASSQCQKLSHRRVIHLEFAEGPLPEPLEWYESYT